MSNFILYDGHCGLCHRWVSFTLKYDTEEKFLFCPLQSVGEEEVREKFGDTIVVVTDNDEVLSKSDAALFVLKALPGSWRVLGAVGHVIPKSIRDFVYERVAAVRRKLFAKPNDLCPIVPLDVRKRFVDVLPEEERQKVVNA